MKKLFLLAALAVFTGCPQEKTEEKPQAEATQVQVSATTPAPPIPTKAPVKKADTLAPFEKGVVINYQFQNSIVQGTTNLPDGTELLISVENTQSGYHGSVNTTVSNEAFQGGPFSNGEAPLSPGSYLIHVGTGVTKVQPEQIQKIMGKNGENLKGPLVEKSDLGTAISKDMTVQLGSSQAAKAADKELTAKVNDLYARLNTLLGEGRGMEKLRNTDNTASLAECGNKMRRHQAEAKQLSNEAQGLSGKYIQIKIAANEMDQCVSCLERDALKACNRAGEALAEVKKDL